MQRDARTIALSLFSAAILVGSFVSPALAAQHTPPWSDAMWAHFPGSGGLDTTGAMSYVDYWSDFGGYHGFTTNPSTMPVAMSTSYAQDDAIWWMGGHGAAGTIQTYSSSNGWGSLYVSNNAPLYSTCAAPNDCLTDYTNAQMHDIRLMVFHACDSADATPNGDRLNKRAHDVLGVDASIGFTNLVYFGPQPDHWSDYFMQSAAVFNYTTIDSLASAASTLQAQFGQMWGYDSYSVYGGTVKIKPAAYGT